MKNPIKLMLAAVLMVAAFSCEKQRCVTCAVQTNAPDADSYSTYCGTEYEISKEDARIKSDCEALKALYPQYSFTCGCN